MGSEKVAEKNGKDEEIGEDAKNPKDGATAEDLAKEFQEHSVAEFFKKNRQMLGLYGKIRTLTTIVHEYVSNSLDACEEARTLPKIEVKLDQLGEDYYEVTVRDNGPGLTLQSVGKAFGKLLAGTKFHRLMQMRGQQGIGASGVTLFSQITTGKATQIITGTGNETISLEITIDPKKNEPKLANVETLKRQFKGTAIKAKFKDVKYIQSDQSPMEYLRRTAIANPHAEIEFIEPSGDKTVFHRTLSDIPLKPIEVQPHPKGVTVDELISMAKYADSFKVSSFLKNEFDRMGDKAIGEIRKEVSFDLNKNPKKLTWEEAEEVVNAFKKIDFIAPRMDALRPIGEDRIKKSLQSILKPEFLSVIERKPTVYKGGFTFQIEAAIAFGGEAGKASANQTAEEKANAKDDMQKLQIGKHIEVMRFANRTPLLFDGGGCAITKAVQTIDWKRYGIKDLDNAPLSVLVNISSVFVPYTSAGKQAIAEEDEIVEEIRLALMEAGRKIARYIVGKRKEAEKQEKKRLYMRYAPEVAIAVSALTKDPRKDLEKELLDIVLRKLKLDEAQDKKVEEESDDEIENELENELKKEAKKKKPKKGSEESEEVNE
ncbi:MAG: DNA topoisomerase VI subunit B [archaeon]